MELTIFVQPGQSSTLAAIEQLINAIEPDHATFCFAYMTLSGCAEFQRRVGPAFWNSVETKWLTGIDYGRTQPAALEFISSKANSALRVFHGSNVVQTAGFVPSQDFHMKTCVLSNEANGVRGVVIGSGNFSMSGLVSNIEGGASLVVTTEAEFQDTLAATVGAIAELWDQSTPVEELVEEYEELWTSLDVDAAADDEAEEVSAVEADAFWIDVGYVTRNRGQNKPGNQIDMPRGVHQFFGLAEPANIGPNTVIGDVHFAGPGDPVTRHLRLGNNLMEKITLPLPENYGFGAYDGKILEFRRAEVGFELATFELDEFEKVLTKAAEKSLHHMGSGRTYGYRKE